MLSKLSVQDNTCTILNKLSEDYMHVLTGDLPLNQFYQSKPVFPADNPPAKHQQKHAYSQYLEFLDYDSNKFK